MTTEYNLTQEHVIGFFFLYKPMPLKCMRGSREIFQKEGGWSYGYLSFPGGGVWGIFLVIVKCKFLKKLNVRGGGRSGGGDPPPRTFKFASPLFLIRGRRSVGFANEPTILKALEDLEKIEIFHKWNMY